MSKSDIFEADLLDLIFKQVTIAGLARDDVSPITNFSIALHTADPGDTGNQTTTEATYGGYTRVNVARNAGWTRTGNSISPTAVIDFPECTSSPNSNVITFWSVGTGVGNKILYSGSVSPSITIAIGVIPRLKTTSTITED